jgi:hypothetical protein
MVKTFPSLKLRLKSRHQLHCGIKVIRSMGKFKYLQHNVFTDKTLCKLSLGPEEDGTARSQWKKMVDNPNEHSFSWHEVYFE